MDFLHGFRFTLSYDVKFILLLSWFFSDSISCSLSFSFPFFPSKQTKTTGSTPLNLPIQRALVDAWKLLVQPISATGTFLGCFLAGTSFVLKSHNISPEWVAILAVSGVLIFPIHVKGLLGAWWCWSIGWVLGQFPITFNFLMSWSASGTFFIYSAFSVMTVLFVVKLVPETQGTLEEIQASINS